MLTNEELIQRAKKEYTELGGMRNKTAKLLRALWERLEIEEDKVKELQKWIYDYF